MKHMVIAPGEPVDRTWFESSYAGVRWVPQREVPFTFELATDSILDELPEPLRATLHTYHHPAWRILLRFFVDDRLGPVSPVIPLGYVLPGSVHGVKLESRPWGIWTHDARNHWWELGNAGYRVPCEVLAEHPDMVRQNLAHMEIRPLPPEAAHGCPPRPDMDRMPHTPEEIVRILNGDA